MLSTFFSTSKPINYLSIIIFGLIIVVFNIYNYATSIWESLLTILVLIVSLFIFQFIIIKNELTPQSTYALWIASCLVLILCASQLNIADIIGVFFVLLALRRVISLRSGRNAIKKIFDASFCVSIATFFFHWNILVYIVVMIGVFVHVRNDYRHWLTIIIAAASVLFLVFTYDYVFETSMLRNLSSSFQVKSILRESSFNFPQILLLSLIPISLLGIIIMKIKKLDIEKRVFSSINCIVFLAFIGVVIIVLDFESYIRIGFMFTIPFISVLLARMIHYVRNNWIKELIMWSAPLLLLLALLFK